MATLAEMNTLSDRLTAYGFANVEAEFLIGEDAANLSLNGALVTVPWVAPTDSIDILADVDTTTVAPVANDVLQFDGTNWVPAAKTGAQTVTDTATIDLTLTGTALSADFIGTTTNVAEGTNLYFTNARADARIAAASIDALADVDTTTTAPVIGHVLSWDGTNWVNGAPADSTTVTDTNSIDMTLTGTAVSADLIVDPNAANLLSVSGTGVLAALASIDGHTDVDTTTAAPTAGQYLTWNGTNWVPGTITLPGEYSGGFDASAGTFPATDGIDGSTVNSQDWFNVTVAGTVDGQAFTVGDRLVAIVDNPSTATFAANWAVIASPAAPVTSVNGLAGAVVLGIDNLSDVDTTTAAPAVGEVLQWDGTNWVPATNSPVVASITDTATIDLTLTGTALSADFIGTTTNVAEGTNLYFTNARADARIAAASIDALADVDTTTTAPVIGHVLSWDGTNWVNGAPAADTVSSITDTNSIDLTLTGTALSADVIVDPAATNLLSVSGTGVLATYDVTVTTDGNATGVTAGGTATARTVDIIVTSADAGNVASVGTDGGTFVEPAQVFESLAVSTTFSTTMQSKISATAAAVVGGTYKVTVTYGWNHDQAGSDFEAEFQVNAAATTSFGSGLVHKQEPKDAAGNVSGTGSAQAHRFTHVETVVLAAGATPTFDLNYRTDDAAFESSIWDARIILERII